MIHSWTINHSKLIVIFENIIKLQLGFTNSYYARFDIISFKWNRYRSNTMFGIHKCSVSECNDIAQLYLQLLLILYPHETGIV